MNATYFLFIMILIAITSLLEIFHFGNSTSLPLLLKLQFNYKPFPLLNIDHLSMTKTCFVEF